MSFVVFQIVNHVSHSTMQRLEVQFYFLAPRGLVCLTFERTHRFEHLVLLCFEHLVLLTCARTHRFEYLIILSQL